MACSSAAALLDEFFEHPAKHLSVKPHMRNSETAGHRSAVSLTGLGVHVSMIPRIFLKVYRQHTLLTRRRFTVPIVTKEACT